MKSKKNLLACSVFSVALTLGSSPSAHAADGTWTGDGGSWEDATNWTDEIIATGADSTATFTGLMEANLEVDLSGNQTLGGLIFGNSSPEFYNWSLFSSSLPSSVLTLATTTAGTPFVSVESSTAVEISLGIAGTQGLTKTGDGALVLSGENTYTGATTITGGTLSLTNSASLDVASAVSLGGATSILDISGITAASEVIGSLAGVAGSSVVLGDKNLSTGGDATSTLFAGNISGEGGSLTQQGASFGAQLILSGTNTYTGTTLVQSGRLQFAKQASLYNNSDTNWTKENISVNSGAMLALNVGGDGEFTSANVTKLLENLTVDIDNNGFRGGSRIGFDTSNAAAGEFTIADAIHDSTGIGAGSLGVWKHGANTLILSGENSYTGYTYVFGGELVLAGNSTYGSVGVSGGTLTLVDSVNISGRVSLYSSTYGNGGNLDVSGITTSGVSMGGLNGHGENSVVLGDRNLTLDPASSEGSAYFYGSISGNGGSVTKRGSGRQTLAGANTYTGTTRIEEGILAFRDRESLYNGETTSWTKENINVQSGAVLGLAVGSTGKFTAGDITTMLGNLTSNLSNNGMQAGASLAFITQTEVIFNYDGDISDSNGTGGGSLGITMIDDGSDQNYFKGRVVLSGMNSYSGETHVASGALQFSKRSSLYGGDSAMWNVDNIRLDYGGELALNVGGVGEFTSGDIQVLLSNNVFSTSGTLGLDTTSGDVHLTEFNAPSGLQMRKLGANTLTFGATSYSGTTYIDEGSLRLTGANNSDFFFIVPQGKLVLEGSASLRNDAEIYSSGSLDISGIDGSEMTFRNISSGYTEIGAKNIIIDSKLDVVGSESFDYLPDYLWSVSGTGGSLIKNGSGRLMIGNGYNPENNIFRGTTIVNGGILEMNGASEGDLFVNSGGRVELNTSHYGNAVVSGGRLNVGGLGYNGLGWGLYHEPDIHRYGSLNGDVDVKSGGTLGGHGFIYGAVTVESGGKLAPGTSIGSLQSESLSFAHNSTYAYEVDSSVAPEVGADLHTVMGTLDLAGTVTLSLTNLAESPAAFAPGTVFTLINYTGDWNGGLFTVGGSVISDGETFNSGLNTWQIDYDALAGGLNFSDEYLTGDFDGGTGRFVNITAMEVIPEPSSLFLGALGSLALMRRRRKEG